MPTVGFEPQPEHILIGQNTCIADSDEEAERLYFPHVHYFYQKCLNVWEGWAEPPGYRTPATIKAGVRAQFGAKAKAIRSQSGSTKSSWVVDSAAVVRSKSCSRGPMSRAS